MTKPTVSIIVPTHNAENTLGACLKGLLKQTYRPSEIIVFLDGSTDSSEQIARKAGVKILQNNGPPKGPAYGRNKAAAAATSDFLWFVDADVVVAPTSLTLLVDEILNYGAAAAFGSYDDRPRSDRSTSLYANLRHHFVHQHGQREAATFWSGIGLIRRDIFFEFGGFDAARFPHPSVEDIDLGMKVFAAGYRIRLVPEALGKHCKDWSLWRVWHTDIFRRARPWARMLIERSGAPKNLNIVAAERIKALLAALVLALLLVGIFYPGLVIGSVVAASAYLFANRKFIKFLADRVAPAGLLVAVLMHWCYHLYSATTYMFTMIELRLRRLFALGKSGKENQTDGMAASGSSGGA